MERYLERFGHRAVFEMEIASVRWQEDPRYLLDQSRFPVDHSDTPDPRARAEGIRVGAQRDLRALPW